MGANVLTTRLLNQFRRSATLLRFVGEGVVALDAEGRILFSNPAAERLLGWGEGTLLGRDFHETVHHRRADGRRVAREECALLSALAETEDDLVHVNDHDVFTRKDGSTFMAGFVSAAIKYQGENTGLATLFRDITTEKGREAALQLHAAALDAVPEPVFSLGRDGSILYANTEASDHLGYSRDEMARMRVFDFDVDFPPDRWHANWERLRRGGVASIESRHRTREGQVVPVAIEVRHVEHEGQEFHVAVARRREGA